MKNVIVTKFTHAEADEPQVVFGFVKIPERHTMIRAEGEDLVVSDGYHTFDELYDHRVTLYIALCAALAGLAQVNEVHGTDKSLSPKVWRSKRHSDGEICFGTGTQFIMGIGKENGTQISYHIPIERWEETNFAETLEIAPEFDGHSSADVLERLKFMYK